MHYLVSLLPPLLLVALLVWLDSFALVKKWLLLTCFIWGIVVTYMAVFFNVSITRLMPSISLVVAPVVEETLKGLLLVLIIRRRWAMFFIDAAIYGVAVGAGFAVSENISYLGAFPDMLFGTALMRGMGTAIMHCGAVASTAVILNWFMTRKGHTGRYFFLALLPGILLHTIYNSLIIPPMMVLPVICLGVTSLIGILFMSNEKSIAKWLDDELAAEVKLLSAMQKGMFSQTKAGQYLMTVKEKFAPDRFMDMYCYVRLYLELSIAAKRNMMLSEAGFPVPDDPDTMSKIKEFNILKKNIGKTAWIVLAPIVKQDKIDWKIKVLR